MDAEVLDVDGVATRKLLSISGLPFGIRRYEAPLVPEDVCRAKTSSSRRKHNRADSKKSRHRHRAALEERSYLENHKILPFVDKMLKILAKERPSDPWKAIAEMLPEGDIEAFMSTPPEKPALVDVGDLSSFKKPYQFQPSVGTWLSMKRRFVPVGVERSGAEESIEASEGATLVQKRTEGEVAAVVEVSDLPFDIVVDLPEEAQINMPFSLKPSVGTWQSRLRQDQKDKCHVLARGSPIDSRGEVVGKKEVFEVCADGDEELEITRFDLTPCVGTRQQSLLGSQDTMLDFEDAGGDAPVAMTKPNPMQVTVSTECPESALSSNGFSTLSPIPKVPLEGSAVDSEMSSQLTCSSDRSYTSLISTVHLDIIRSTLAHADTHATPGLQKGLIVPSDEGVAMDAVINTSAPIPRVPLAGSVAHSELSSNVSCPTDRSYAAARLVRSTIGSEGSPGGLVKASIESKDVCEGAAAFAKVVPPAPVVESEISSQLTCLSDRSYTSLISTMHLDIIRSTLEAQASSSASLLDYEAYRRPKGLIVCNEEGVDSDLVLDTTALIPRVPLEGSVVESEASCSSDRAHAASRLVHSSLPHAESQPLASPSNASSGNPASFASRLVKATMSEAEYASVASSRFTLQRDSRPCSGRNRSVCRSRSSSGYRQQRCNDLDFRMGYKSRDAPKIVKTTKS